MNNNTQLVIYHWHGSVGNNSALTSGGLVSYSGEGQEPINFVYYNTSYKNRVITG